MSPDWQWPERIEDPRVIATQDEGDVHYMRVVLREDQIGLIAAAVVAATDDRRDELIHDCTLLAESLREVVAPGHLVLRPEVREAYNRALYGSTL